MVERLQQRMDPESGNVYTFDEFKTCCKGLYKDKEIESYWNDSCEPVKRFDPEDGKVYTWNEINAFYKGWHTDKEIATYWYERCRPATIEEENAAVNETVKPEHITNNAAVVEKAKPEHKESGMQQRSCCCHPYHKGLSICHIAITLAALVAIITTAALLEPLLSSDQHFSAAKDPWCHIFFDKAGTEYSLIDEELSHSTVDEFFPDKLLVNESWATASAEQFCDVGPDLLLTKPHGLDNYSRTFVFAIIVFVVFKALSIQTVCATASEHSKEVSMKTLLGDFSKRVVAAESELLCRKCRMDWFRHLTGLEPQDVFTKAFLYLMLTWLPNMLIFPLTTMRTVEDRPQLLVLYVDFDWWWYLVVIAYVTVCLLGIAAFVGFVCLMSLLCIELHSCCSRWQASSAKKKNKNMNDAEKAAIEERKAKKDEQDKRNAAAVEKFQWWFVGGTIVWMQFCTIFMVVMALILIVARGISVVLLFELRLLFSISFRYNVAAWAGVTRILLFVLSLIENYFFLVLPGSMWLLEKKGKAHAVAARLGIDSVGAEAVV